MDVELTPAFGRATLPFMAPRVKRTYNLSPGTVQRVRELAGRYDVARSQDSVVELAIDRLYTEIRDMEEAALWAKAAEDAEFRAEMAGIAADLADVETWPH